MISIIWYVGIGCSIFLGLACLMFDGDEEDGLWIGATAILFSWAWPVLIPIIAFFVLAAIFKFLRWYILKTVNVFNEMRA